MGTIFIHRIKKASDCKPITTTSLLWEDDTLVLQSFVPKKLKFSINYNKKCFTGNRVILKLEKSVDKINWSYIDTINLTSEIFEDSSGIFSLIILDIESCFLRLEVTNIYGEKTYSNIIEYKFGVEIELERFDEKLNKFVKTNLEDSLCLPCNVDNSITIRVRTIKKYSNLVKKYIYYESLGTNSEIKTDSFIFNGSSGTTYIVAKIETTDGQVIESNRIYLSLSKVFFEMFCLDFEVSEVKD